MTNKITADCHDVDHNVDHAVVADFGHDWQVLDQSSLSEADRQKQFDAYFSVFPWARLPADAEGFDAGCGSGRWAALVAPRVGRLHCVDPSEAIQVAKKNLAQHGNCSFHQVTVGGMPFADGSMDFGYSLGVLHHIPDTRQGIVDCVRKLKPGAPFLVYLYYAFDNQPMWFKWLWKVSDWVRVAISRMPHRAKYWASQIIAGTVYFPLARAALILEKLGCSVHSWPLSAYRDKPFYWMRTDALDRFGTKLEQRFTRAEITSMMESAGLDAIEFNQPAPYHCAVGYKK